MKQNSVEAKIPNFFIVGAAKSGTTSVYEYLSQHPDIYLSPNKEPHFFSNKAFSLPHNGPGDNKYNFRRIKKTWEDYIDLFKGVKNEKVLGEASTSYLHYYRTAAPLIYKSNPEAKILIILRNPVDRAFSAYWHMIRDKRETLSFEDALKSEENRKKENFAGLWFYTEVGFYYNQVKEYLNTFDKNSVKICLFDDFDKNPKQVIDDIFRFLGVDDNFNPNINIKHNTSKLSKFGTLNRFFNDYDHPLKKVLRPIFFNTVGRDNTDRLFHYTRDKFRLKMKPETRRYLNELYREDILKLQELIGRDLSSWM